MCSYNWHGCNLWSLLMMTIFGGQESRWEGDECIGASLIEFADAIGSFLLQCPMWPFQGSSRFLFRWTHLAWRKEPPVDIYHGQWLNTPDFDAPTQLVQSLEHDAEHVHAVMITPERKGIDWIHLGRPWWEMIARISSSCCKLMEIALTQKATITNAHLLLSCFKLEGFMVAVQ